MLDHWSSRVRRHWVLPLLASVPVAAVVVGLGACLPVPLGDPEKSAVDARLAGVWSSDLKEGQGTCLVAVPFDTRAYFVHVVEVHRGDDEAAEWSVQCKGHYKAWLTPVKGETFISLARLDAPKANDSPTYVVAHIGLMNDDRLIAEGVDPEFPALKEAFKGKEPRALVQKVITENVDNEKLYGEGTDLTVAYDRVKDEKVLRAIRAAFSDD